MQEECSSLNGIIQEWRFKFIFKKSKQIVLISRFKKTSRELKPFKCILKIAFCTHYYSNFYLPGTNMKERVLFSVHTVDSESNVSYFCENPCGVVQEFSTGSILGIET